MKRPPRLPMGQQPPRPTERDEFEKGRSAHSDQAPGVRASGVWESGVENGGSESADPVEFDRAVQPGLRDQASSAVEDATFLNSLLDAVPAIIIRVDAQGRIRYVNRYLPGYDAKDVLGKDVYDYVAAEHVSIVRERIEQVLRTGERSSYRITGRGAEGSMRQYETIVAPTAEPDGQRGACLIALDITDQLAAEARLRQTQKLEALGSVTAGVAHNFNNMLAVILPFVEQAVQHPERRDPELALVALQATQRAIEMVRQLMKVAGRGASRKQPFDLVGVVAAATEMCRPVLERRVRFDVTLATAPLMVSCDAAEIEQVVVNLCLNARDAVVEAGRADPWVALSLSRVRSSDVPEHPDRLSVPHVCVKVRDNGVGIDSQAMERLYEPFFTTKGPDRGTGLGLPMSRTIVAEHHGYIACETEPGQGATFFVYLPLLETEPDLRRPPSGERAEGVRRILLVDDEPQVRRTTRLLLEMEGIAVFEAEQAEEAVAALEQQGEFDAILLDRNLPGLRGEAVVRAARAHCPNARVIYFTGGAVTDEERARVDAVLHKPVSSEVLFAALDRE